MSAFMLKATQHGMTRMPSTIGGNYPTRHESNDDHFVLGMWCLKCDMHEMLQLTSPSSRIEGSHEKPTSSSDETELML